jgi:hypothetical protein
MASEEGGCHIAIADLSPSTEVDGCRAAVKVHGIFPTATEARSAIHQWANEQTDIDAFVVEDVGRWIVVHPVKDGADEEEEIPTTENDDPSQGRYGSVCNIRKSAGRTEELTHKESIQGSIDTPVSKKKAIQTQCIQLDELLSDNPQPSQIHHNQSSYDACREHFATLRAFERRLRALYTTSLEKCKRVATEIEGIDTNHPTYHTQYRARYEEALRGSGIDPKEVTLMRFIEP